MANRLTIARVHGRDAEQARGVVIVIDVLRAFTVAAYALAGGARQLCLVRTIEEAQTLRAEMYPDALLAGEVGRRMIPGFDLNNSPARMQSADVRHRLVIQRTGAGTQGAVNARHASHLLVASLVNARATATYAAQLANAHTNGLVSLVPTANAIEDEGREAFEDDVCAAYLNALFSEDANAGDILARGIAQLYESDRFGIWMEGSDDFPADDVPSALAADRFSFAMEGERHHVGAIEYIAVRRVDVEAG